MLLNQLKKTDYNTKFSEIENNFLLIMIIVINILLHKNLANKNDITDLVKKTNFAEKLKNLNKHVASNRNELNDASKKVKTISTKGLTKVLIN